MPLGNPGNSKSESTYKTGSYAYNVSGGGGGGGRECLRCSLITANGIDKTPRRLKSTHTYSSDYLDGGARASQ